MSNDPLTQIECPIKEFYLFYDFYKYLTERSDFHYSTFDNLHSSFLMVLLRRKVCYMVSYD